LFDTACSPPVEPKAENWRQGCAERTPAANSKILFAVFDWYREKIECHYPCILGR